MVLTFVVHLNSNSRLSQSGYLVHVSSVILYEWILLTNSRIMRKGLYGIFCVLSYIAVSRSLEFETQELDNSRVYDLTGLLAKTTKRLQTSLLHRDDDLLKDLLQFPGINFDFELKLSLKSSPKCMGDLMYIYQNIKSQWALKMLDSFGKPESSILEGNLKWIGDYNECVGTRVTNPNSTSLGNFNGKYCSLTWSLTSLNLSLPFTFVSGVCIPDSCSEEDLEEDALQLLKLSGILPDVNSTESLLSSNALKCKPRERPLNVAAKAMIALLSLICGFSFLGSSITAAKYFTKILDDFKVQPSPVHAPENSQFVVKDDINDMRNNIFDGKSSFKDRHQGSISNGCLHKAGTFFRCFCVFTNGAKMLNTETSEGELLCIHGIRFLSMSWVIIGHTYSFGNIAMKNTLGILPLVNTFAFQAILQAFFAVDSFFVLSGFLLTYLFMNEYTKKKGNMSWGYFYVHRFVRLTPMYMVLLGFSAAVFSYLGSEPYWPDEFDPACRDVWWENLLYINNFYGDKGQCFGHTWYLANDMQFFVISPIFLITLFRWPKIGYTLLAIFLFTSCLANFFISYNFDLGNGVISFMNKGTIDPNTVPKLQKQFADYFSKLYVKPYTRIGPYLIGMLTGYLLFKRKAIGNPKHNLMFLSIGWIFATSITLATVYGMYHTNPTLVASSIYNAFSRITYALGLSWLIYVCLIGQGGFVNSILSCKMFIPLSRLTYATYLIHPMIINGYFASQTTSLEFTHRNIVILFLGFMVITYSIALPVALILESPIVSLEKIIRKSFVKKQNTDTVN